MTDDHTCYGDIFCGSPRVTAQANCDACRDEWELEQSRNCQYCGEEGTEENPIVETIVSPPVSGWEPETARAHRSCSGKAALDMVR